MQNGLGILNGGGQLSSGQRQSRVEAGGRHYYRAANRQWRGMVLAIKKTISLILSIGVNILTLIA